MALAAVRAAVSAALALGRLRSAWCARLSNKWMSTSSSLSSSRFTCAPGKGHTPLSVWCVRLSSRWMCASSSLSSTCAPAPVPPLDHT